MTASFLSFTPALQAPAPDDEELAKEIAEAMLSVSRKTFADSGHGLRSVHAKSHGLIKCELEVLPSLPAPYAQGLFAMPGRYQAMMRLSTIPGDILSDKVSTPRGAALKIIQVPGERPEGSETKHSQDFVMVNGPTFSTDSPKGFLKALKLVAMTTDKAEGAKEVLAATMRAAERVVEAFGGNSPMLRALGGEPPTNILGETFFTQLPLRFGEHVAKIQLVPASADLLALKGNLLDLAEDDDIVRKAVVAHFATHSGRWDLRAQLCTSDLSATPIEDPTKIWDENLTPFVTVARLHASPQVAWSQARSVAVDDGMAFNPWQCLEAHRPLGQFMRLRRFVYAASRQFRSERNRTPVTEPATFDHLPE